MARDSAVLEVTYGDHLFVFDDDVRACAKVAGIRELGTGYSFEDRVRDLTFRCKDEDEACYAAGVLRSNLPKRVKIKLLP